MNTADAQGASLSGMSPDYAAVKLDADLAALEREWKPFSMPAAIWQACPGHEWERLAWNRREQRLMQLDDPDNSLELITRCGKCGAPRCDTHDPTAADHVWEWLDDRQRQFWRCTLERHHRDEHDFLSGTTLPIGG